MRRFLEILVICFSTRIDNTWSFIFVNCVFIFLEGTREKSVIRSRAPSWGRPKAHRCQKSACGFSGDYCVRQRRVIEVTNISHRRRAQMVWTCQDFSNSQSAYQYDCHLLGLYYTLLAAFIFLTEADEQNDQRALNRSLDRKLLLLVRQRLNAFGGGAGEQKWAWTPPLVVWRPDETLRSVILFFLLYSLLISCCVCGSRFEILLRTCPLWFWYPYRPRTAR